MEELLVFLGQYGWPLTLIAILGIIVLGVLKYLNVFNQLEEKHRHYLYIGISVLISIVGALVYMFIIKQFNWSYLFAYASAVYALNQAFYNIFKVTKINDLGTKVLDIIKKLITAFKSNETK